MTQQITDELHRIVSVLRDSYHPEKIILYGSQVGGLPHNDSDLDLVIIKTTNRRFYDRIGDVLRLVRPTQAVDILVYTPSEYQRLVKESWFVGEEIDKKGKTLFSA